MANWLKENTMLLSVVAASVGFVATLLGVFGVMIPEHAPDFMVGVLETIGNWGYWLLVIGIILLIGGIWQMWSIISKQKKFEKLIDVDGKAKFLRNQDDLEYLAWSLGGEYKERVKEKKRMFKIK
ncbi:MAG TPA: DUF3198 domain-containing protein [Euryarchaeota archaeon]|nr:DUF3198 domain-containing protein [Euryarchaeota archaeon]